MAFLQLNLNGIGQMKQQIILVWNVAIMNLSLNIDFSKESSQFCLIYIQFSRKLWFDTVVFSYPKPTFEGVTFLLKIRWFIELFYMTVLFEWVPYI